MRVRVKRFASEKPGGLIASEIEMAKNRTQRGTEATTRTDG
jgi:hypothetical protein